MVMAVPQLQGICAAAFTFIAPVAGDLARRFEAPLGPYASGHRGIDYSVPAGSPVRASSDGTVTFAGPVADDGLFVTLRHEAQIETTYSFMSQVGVAEGQRVRQGEVLGLSGEGHDPVMPGLHFGAKIAGAYVDPQLLLIGDLDDVSKFIHLAAMDGQGSGDGLQGPSVFEPRSTSGSSDDDEGLWVSMGSGIAKAGRWLLGVPGAVGGFVQKAANSAWGGLRELGSWLWSGVEAGGRFIADEVRRDVELLKGFGRIVLDSMKQLWGWVKSSLFAVGRAIRDAVVSIWRVIESVTGAIWRAVKSVSSKVWRHLRSVVADLLPVRLVTSYMDQRKCEKSSRGPTIPTRAEMRAGAEPPPPPNENIVVAVAGIGSWTMGKDGAPRDGASIYQLDFETLGYPEDRIFHYSYRGLEDRGGRGPYRLHAPYTKEDTYKSIEESAALLDEQLREIHRRYPDKKIDLVAHSQGGLVAEVYVERFHRKANPLQPQIGSLLTMGTPHKGADLASLDKALRRSFGGKRALAGLTKGAAWLGMPPPSAPATRQMAENSDFMYKVNAEWNPSKVRTATIAATFDYVVTAPKSQLEGANFFVADLPPSVSSIAGAHSALPKAPNAKQIAYQFLQGRTQGCSSFRELMASEVVGPSISAIEDLSIQAYAGLLGP